VTQRLGGKVPVAIDADPDTWEETAEELDDIFLGDAELWRRSFNESANPRGGDNPVVTAEGHMLIDIQFYPDKGIQLFGETADYHEVAHEIESVPGVVAHGLVVGQATAAVLVKSTQEPEIVWLSDVVKASPSPTTDVE
jgi:ribose 5-phosphate isomerase A